MWAAVVACCVLNQPTDDLFIWANTGEEKIPREDVGGGARNSVWDPDKSKVSLFAAQNEVVSFALIVENRAVTEVSGISVALDKLTGPSGHVISSRATALSNYAKR